ncbi:ABC transporter permease [Rhodobacter maris]|uniref:ABC-2 type transport system permease protein n=1 Tax=Rhodobacter maris TaxID=446682 RepID=A0A285RI15_9RHOB|nr:ABC transporter permease [Rhodobacter maris]SOB93730.1 ABC-2 type transport system permease protein [Rhodobacter maris]
MLRSLRNIGNLTLKELRAIRGDAVMLVLIAYVFTAAVWLVSQAGSTEVRDLTVAVVDDDRSQLSARLIDAIRPPLFRAPDLLTPEAAQRAQIAGKEVLVVSIPPDLEKDLRAGRGGAVMVLVDATAVAFAGNGTSYVTQALAEAASDYLAPGTGAESPLNVVVRNRFNPNLSATWFTAVMQIINNVTILMLILSGASLLRERERGTIEHVLVMPVHPHEVVLSKVFANGGVILIASVLSLVFVVEGAMGVPIAGSLPLYVAGAAIYVVAVASLGLMMASYTRNMGQYGLLVIPVMILMLLLSGGITPMESMPQWLQILMRTVSPTPHFVAFAQAVLYRGAGLWLVVAELAAMAAMAAVALALVLRRFRKLLS